MTDPIQHFYDDLAREYHLLFADWPATVRWQGALLDRLIRAYQSADRPSILDCACGIGTQALGLALLGHTVHGTDRSPAAVERARQEAAHLGLGVTFGVADMRTLDADVANIFDVIYQPMYLRLGRSLAAHHGVFLSGNTRGHDYGSWCERGDSSFLAGVAWERLEEAPRDVAAWVRFTVAHGPRRVVLAGHSLGALKVTAYLAEHHDLRVAGLALVSPPLRPAWDTGAHADLLAQAERLVADGQAEQLLPGPWLPLSAQTLLSTHRFGLDQFGRARSDAPVARVHCPVLVILGTNEPHIGIRDDREVVRANARAAPRIDLRVLEGADHFYAGHERELADMLAAWAADVT